MANTAHLVGMKDVEKFYTTDDGLNVILNYARRGLEVKEIAESIGISKATFDRWRKKHPEMNEAINRGRLMDYHVENALYKSAVGQTLVEETWDQDEYGELKLKKRYIKEVKGELGAQIFILKNRIPKFWKEKLMDSSDLEAIDKVSAMLENVRKFANSDNKLVNGDNDATESEAD